MLTTQSYTQVKTKIRERILDDAPILDKLRQEVRGLKSAVRRIQPRTTTAISLVAADGN